MKNFFLGIVWFFVIWVGLILIMSFLTSMTATPKVLEIDDPVLRQEMTRRLSAEAGDKYAWIVFFFSIAASSLGTFFGILPGTKPKYEDRY